MTPDSKSTSDFSIELPETMYFDNNSSVFYIDVVCLPHSWYTVEENLNNKLYLHMQKENPVQRWSIIVSLTPNNYTGTSLASHLQAIMNSSIKGTGKPLPANSLLNPFTVVYIANTNKLEISMEPIAGGADQFNILTPTDLKTKHNNTFTESYNVTNPGDCNELIGNMEGHSKLYSTGAGAFTSGALNLQPIRNVYMHSSALGNLSNIGPDGSQTVIKKIPIQAEYNNFIFDQTVMYNDYNSCSGQTLKKLDFQLKTSRGEIIPLRGINVSFSLIFSRAQPDA
jgi:hypothetical protein